MSKVSRRAALIGLAAAAVPVQAAMPVGHNTWAPTELGRRLMALIPAHVEAVYSRCNMVDVSSSPEYDAERVAAADRAETASHRRLERAAKAILKRPVTEPAHLTDLAIIQSAWDDGGERWECPYVESRAARALVSAILALGGVPRRECSIDEAYKAYKKQREGGRHV